MKTNRPELRHPARVGRLVAAGAVLGAVSVPAWAALPASASQSITISTMQTASHGTVLVSGGRTIYTLQPSSTPCTTACLHVWPAVMLTSSQKKAVAGHGVKASALGTVKVSGGRQVTYQGKRLYWYSGDSGPGQVNGNFSDQWGTWAAVVTTAQPSSASSSSPPATSTPTTSSNSGTGGASF